MKRRATVERVYRVREGNWYVLIWTDGWFDHGRTFPTHADALAHALAEVGLTEKNTEKENTMEHDDEKCSNPGTLCDDCLYYGAQENQ